MLYLTRARMLALEVWRFVNLPENTFYRFVVIGTTSLGVHILMLMAFIYLIGDTLLANRLAFVGLSLIQFIGHINWTFREARGISAGRKILSLGLFFAGRYAFSFPNEHIFSYVLSLGWVHWLGWIAPIFCQMVASATIMPFNYLYMKRVVIRLVRHKVQLHTPSDVPAEVVKAE